MFDSISVLWGVKCIHKFKSQLHPFVIPMREETEVNGDTFSVYERFIVIHFTWGRKCVSKLFIYCFLNFHILYELLSVKCIKI